MPHKGLPYPMPAGTGYDACALAQVRTGNPDSMSPEGMLSMVQMPAAKTKKYGQRRAKSMKGNPHY